MKLYYFFVAPNPTRVRIYLREKGIEIEEVFVDMREGEQKSEAHLARHPFGKLPVLELREGEYIHDSTAIMEFLEELHPDPPMLGTHPEERAHARVLERIADLGVLIGTARAVHSTNSPLGLPAVPAIAESALEERANALRFIDQQLAATPYLGGDRPGMADCTAFAGLTFGRFFGIDVDPEFGHVVSWLERFGERDSVASL